MLNKRNIGSEFENIASEYLKSKSVVILDKNFRSSKGEVDIIGLDGDTLVFFEVKQRKDDLSGFAEEAVGFAKQKRICAVCDHYRAVHKEYFLLGVRFDVIAIDGDHITWLKNAFEYTGLGF